MKMMEGRRGASCARLNAELLGACGFTLGNGKPLDSIVRPTKFVSLLWRHGLLYEGEPVEMRVVVTGDRGVGDHVEGLHGVWGKEVSSGVRAVRKAYTSEAAPGSSLVLVPQQVPDASLEKLGGIPTQIGANRPSWLGVHLAFIFGHQSVYTIAIPKLEASALARPLAPYPGKLDRITALKKHLLFSRPVIYMIRYYRNRSMDRFDGLPSQLALNMLQPSSTPDYDTAVLYNCVVTRSVDGSAEACITPLKNQNPRALASRHVRRVNWLLAKHVLLSGYHPNTVFACELWTHRQDDRTVLYLNNNSGTYKPEVNRLEAIAAELEVLFGIPVVTSTL